MIPYGRQSIDDDDVAAVVAVLRGDRITQGPAVERFEDALRAVTGARHAIAFASGTAALHGAMWAAGIGPGDTVATSPLSFHASASCARYVGASVRFVDVDPDTLNLDVGAVPECDALVAVHYAGLPVDLAALARRPRVVVEDAAHALGATTPDGPVGNCARSDMCVFSFHPVKTVTTGEGGAVTTNSDGLAERLRRFRSHGIRPAPEHGGWAYDIDELGHNFRITDLQCALGTSQLAKLERFVTRRNELAARYRALLADAPLELPPAAPPGWRHAYHLFPVRVADRRRVYEAMHAAGIGVQVHYVPIYRLTAYARLGHRPADFPGTERAYAGLLSLPLFPGLTEADQDAVVARLRCLTGADT
ncbi:MAG: UDP-4-amino-4,6-dideoxy-N-acetyl-beta-L-altrosamine transaminase [Acidimicrobiia bacterium]|nr:MAG: UDP-4-amino-4,6-dideoxy-N-acetyl-beta-L-altrosamine transaminase [Acidimicrobiia bacterium]